MVITNRQKGHSSYGAPYPNNDSSRYGSDRRVCACACVCARVRTCVEEERKEKTTLAVTATVSDSTAGISLEERGSRGRRGVVGGASRSVWLQCAAGARKQKSAKGSPARPHPQQQHPGGW